MRVFEIAAYFAVYFAEQAAERSNHFDVTGAGCLAKREIDQKAAIMIVIEYLGNIPPGTRCSAVYFDTERIRREKEFHARLYSENGVHDPDVLHAMVAANVPRDPYWLVSLKPADPSPGETPQLYRVDERTGKILNNPA